MMLTQELQCPQLYRSLTARHFRIFCNVMFVWSGHPCDYDHIYCYVPRDSSINTKFDLILDNARILLLMHLFGFTCSQPSPNET